MIQVMEGAVLGAFVGVMAESQLTIGPPLYCRAAVIGGETGMLVAPVFHAKGRLKGYQSGYIRGKMGEH